MAAVFTATTFIFILSAKLRFASALAGQALLFATAQKVTKNALML